MSEAEKMQIAQNANFIVNGYSFSCHQENIRVLNLNDPARVAILTKEGNVLETSMDDIEIGIIQAYWEKNKQFMEE